MCKHLLFIFFRKEFVNKLAKKLKENKIDVWYDQQELKLGDNILQKIEEALSEAKYIIFVLSKNGVNSNWVQLELATTLNKEIGQEETFIIPITNISQDRQLSNSSEENIRGGLIEKKQSQSF